MTPPLNSDTGANSLASNAYVSMLILTAILTAILILYLKTNLMQSCQTLPKISSHLLPFSLWLFLKTRAILSTNHMQKYNEIDMVLTSPALQLVYFNYHWLIGFHVTRCLFYLEITSLILTSLFRKCFLNKMPDTTSIRKHFASSYCCKAINLVIVTIIVCDTKRHLVLFSQEK